MANRPISPMSLDHQKAAEATPNVPTLFSQIVLPADEALAAWTPQSPFRTRTRRCALEMSAFTQTPHVPLKRPKTP